ncbi:hypothetical protein [Sinorhizobium medicae]
MIPSTLDVYLSAEGRAFLRSVRHAGGSLRVEGRQIDVAEACAATGVVAFTGGTAGSINRVIGVSLMRKGLAYLDRLARAH